LPTSTIPNPEPVSGLPTLTENDVKDGLELRFPTKPAEAVLEKFRQTKHLPLEHRWHWHFRGHFWYARRNEATRAFAAALIAPEAPLSPAAAVPAGDQSTNPPIHPSESNIVPVDFAPPPDDKPVRILNTGALPIWRSRLLHHSQPS
jgi:hypothetical protein